MTVSKDHKFNKYYFKNDFLCNKKEKGFLSKADIIFSISKEKR